VRRARTGLRRLCLRDGRRRPKRPGVAAIGRARGPRSCRAPELDMPQIIML
jgi:hypothetical protein